MRIPKQKYQENPPVITNKDWERWAKEARERTGPLTVDQARKLGKGLFSKHRTS